ncbi:MAG: hypothetical protein WBE82_11805 [Xanthobacteraceae bacterium]
MTEQQIGDLLRHLAGRTLRPIIALALATRRAAEIMQASFANLPGTE